MLSIYEGQFFDRVKNGYNSVKNGVVATGNALQQAGQHIARNKEAYMLGGGALAGAAGLKYWLTPEGASNTTSLTSPTEEMPDVEGINNG